jgi:hypothetical protein
MECVDDKEDPLIQTVRTHQHNTNPTILQTWFMMSDLLLEMFMLASTCWFHNMVTLPSWLVSSNFGTCSYQCSLSNFTHISLLMLKCSWAHTLSYLFMYSSFANIGLEDIMCSIVSSNCWHSLHVLSVSVCNIFGYYYILSPLCRVFTIIYLKQTMLRGYIVLQLFCSYNLWYM